MNTQAVNGSRIPRQWHLAAWFDADGLWNVRWRDRQGNEWVEAYEVRGRGGVH